MTEDFRGPSARAFDWDHILDSHSENGSIARQSGVKTVFIGLTDDQVKARVKAAWRKRKRLRSQFGPRGVERVFYEGIDPRSQQAMRFWYNMKTRIVETVYPVRAKQ